MTETIDPTQSSASTALLEARGVNKSFPGVKALSDMQFELRAGEVLALVGENGAGKSTLMKLISGVYSIDEGEFFFGGEPLVVHGPKDAMEQGISIIHQELNLMNDLTVAQNIFIGQEPTTLGFFTGNSSVNKKARELLDRLDLPLDPQAKVATLSVAQQQMVEIAKALSYDARVIIMDEPTAALNDAEVATLHQLIRRFVTPETGVVYISHKMDEIRRIADRITVIRDGQYVDTLKTEACTIKDVISRMVGREIDVEARPENVRPNRPVLMSVEHLTNHHLHDVSFELREGEILGFAGLMGAGRTEVARAIVGADKIDKGTIHLRGKKVNFSNPAVAAEHRIGYLSEDRKRFGLLLGQSVVSNIALSSLAERFSKLGLIRDRSAIKGAKSFVETLRIKTPSVRQLVKNLSGGNQQKVVIAKWLMKDCDVLIFDEPTRGIDVGAKEEIYALLNELAAQGKSIIMISSELPEVLRMSHRVVVMCEGRVTGELDASDADQEKVMHYATMRDFDAARQKPASEAGTQ